MKANRSLRIGGALVVSLAPYISGCMEPIHKNPWIYRQPTRMDRIEYRYNEREHTLEHLNVDPFHWAEHNDGVLPWDDPNFQEKREGFRQYGFGHSHPRKIK